MIIDIHAHVWTDPAAQQRRAAEAGVDTDVLLSTRFHPEACTTITELTAEFGRLLDGLDGQGGPSGPVRARHGRTARGAEGPAGQRRLRERAAAQAQVERHVGDPRIRGIGELTPAGGHGGEIEPILRIASDHGALPVLTHGFAPNTEQDLRTYAELSGRHPHVPLIVGAFGGMSSMALIDVAQEHPNLYLDLSSALQVFMVRAAAEALPDQCLFGSNSPYGDPVASRATVEAAIADPGVRRQVMGLNAAAVLRL